MHTEALEFTAMGAPSAVSRAIEQYAAGRGGRLSAIVVPWESDKVTLTMAVTAAKGEGWAIEHANVGTIRLTDLGNEKTRVAILSHEGDHADKLKLSTLFDAFCLQIQTKFQTAP